MSVRLRHSGFNCPLPRNSMETDLDRLAKSETRGIAPPRVSSMGRLRFGEPGPVGSVEVTVRIRLLDGRIDYSWHDLFGFEFSVLKIALLSICPAEGPQGWIPRLGGWDVPCSVDRGSTSDARQF